VYTLRDLFSRPLFFPLLIIILGSFIWDLKEPNADFSLPDQICEGVLLKKSRTTEGMPVLDVWLTKSKALIKVFLKEEWESTQWLSNNFATIRFPCRLKKPQGYRNPGVFDYRKFLARQNFVAIAFVDNPNQIETTGQDSRFIFKFKNVIRSKIDSLFATLENKEVVGLQKALLWGDESNLFPRIEKLFRKYGLSHLLVISGLNFGILGWFIYKSFLGLGKIKPRFFLYRFFYPTCAFVSAVLLFLYFLLCEFNAPIARAVVSALGVFLAMALLRSRDYLNLTFLAAFVLLLINPTDLFHPSFQFSFLALLALILVYPALIKPTHGFLMRFFMANLAILITMMPVLAFYFHEVQLLALVGNFLITPLVELIVIPLGFIAALVSLISNTIGIFVFKINLFLLKLIIGILDFFQKDFPNPVPFYPPHPWELVIFYLLLLVCVLHFSKKIKRGFIFILFFILMVDVFVWIIAPWKTNQLQLTHIDVGQGDALLVELPGRKTMLIDGGGSTFVDIGQRVLNPFLKYKRISKLDVVCITHDDVDHFLGLKNLDIPIGEIWWHPISKPSPNLNEILVAREMQGVKLVPVSKGDEKILGEVQIKILNPSSDGKNLSDNNQSLVLQIIHPKGRLLFTGDIEKAAELNLIESEGKNLFSHYLKVAHHGSKYSSLPDFVNLVHPTLATVGSRKSRFHHPHPQTVHTFEELGIPFLQTDQLGAIEVEFTGDVIRVKGAPNEFLKLPMM